MCEVIYEARNEQRNSPGLEILESPSSSDHRGSSNHRNLRTSSSGRDKKSLELECRKLRAEVAKLTAELEKSKAAAIQSDKIHDEVREFHEKGRELHEKERKLSNAKISELEEKLRISNRQSQKAREAQRAAEIELERIKGNIKFKTLMISRCQGDTDSQSDVKSEVGDRSNEKAEREHDLTYASGFNLQNLELEEKMVEECQGEGVEDQQNGEYQEGMEEEKTEDCQQFQNDQLEDRAIRMLPSQVRVLCQSEGWKGWDEANSVVDPKWSSCFSKINRSGHGDSFSEFPGAAHDDDDDSESENGDSRRMKRVEYTQLNVERRHSVQVSKSFLSMEWKKFFKKLGKGRWECNTCGCTSTRRIRAVDHVWSAHHGERFKCLHCDKSFTNREEIKNHTC